MSVSKNRLTDALGRISVPDMLAVERAIKLQLGLS